MGFSTNKRYSDRVPPLADGWHDCIITRAACLRSKAGNSMLGLRFTRFGSPGQIERAYIVLKGYGLDKLGDLCRAAGIPGSEDVKGGLDPENQESSHEWLLGVVVGVDVRNETESYTNHNGETRTTTKPRPIGYRTPSAATVEEIKLHGKPELPEDAWCDFDENDLRGMTEAKKSVAVGKRPKESAKDDGFDDGIPF